MSGPEPGPLCTTISIGLVGLNPCAKAGAVAATVSAAMLAATTTLIMDDVLPGTFFAIRPACSPTARRASSAKTDKRAHIAELVERPRRRGDLPRAVFADR